MFPGGKMKAFTLSYDDGVTQDIRFIELLNKYKLKCTFNLNSGIIGESRCTGTGFKLDMINNKLLKELYKDHEIAMHGLTHRKLTDTNDEELLIEIKSDIENLENISDQKIIGMAYPYGGYDDRVVEMLRAHDVKYARIGEQSFDFEPQTDLLRFKPTCHHNAAHLFDLAKRFVDMKPDKPQIFYVWGHTYEFDIDNNWDYIEDFFKLISGREDIFYGTNKEVLL